MKIVLLPFLFVASAFFSATETALFALRHTDFLKWKEEGNRMAVVVEKMLEKPSALLTTIFIGNEIVNVSISALLASLLVPRFPPHGELLALAAGTLGILILGDIAPKSIAWPRARTFSLLAARPFRLFSLLVAPVRIVMEKLAEGVLFVLGGGRSPEKKGMISEAEFRALVDVGEEAGTLDRGEKELIHNIFEMSDQRAGEIMTPLADVFMVPSILSYGELVREFRRYRRSRIPVFEGERRNVIGILHFKELLRNVAEGEGDVAWRDMVRPPYVIPTSKKLPLLLREFQRRKTHLALVVDEFGDFVGIVTLEDVLEELFGDIREEHDREEKELVRRPDGSHRVLGKMAIHRFNETFGTSLPDQEWDTVAGLLLHEFGRLPGRGDSIALGKHTFTVERLKGTRIAEVGVRPIPPGGGDA